MIPRTRTNIFFKIIFVIFVFMLVWWLSINYRGLENTNENYVYGLALGVFPVLASIFGFINAKQWGGIRSSLGRASIFLSAGLFTWGLGTIIFAYYNLVLMVEVPYPSLADASYIISWPLWVIGMINLSRATGAKFQLKKNTGRLFLFLIPIVVAILSYYLLFVIARGGVLDTSSGMLKLFFDLAYPIGDIFILTTALLVYGLSFNYLGGIFKWPIMLLITGFVFNYFADLIFTYTTTTGTYYVANWVDLIYTLAFICLSLGVSEISPSIIHNRRDDNK